MSFKNTVSFVFGGSEGIGKSIALKVTQGGGTVVIFSRDIKKLDSTLSQLKSINSRSHAECLDVTQSIDVKSIIDKSIKAHGVPNFVFNCAGFAHPGYLDQLDPSVLERMIQVNYLGTAYVCHALVPHLINAKKGIIVNCSSIAGYIGLFGYTGYCASKYAVIGFSEALRRELKPFNIDIKVLCPPNTKTPGLEQENKIKPIEILKTEEKVKPLEPDQVAQYVLKNIFSSSFLLIPNMDGRLAFYLSRWLPKVLDLFVRRTI